MTHSEKPTSVPCLQCSALVASGDKTCWLCGNDLSTQTFPDDHTATPAARSSRTFGLDSLMLVMTLLAICFGVFAVAPGLGVVLIIVAALATIRTAVFVRRHEQEGKTTRPQEKMLVFAASMGVVVLIGIASGIAFYITCWGGGLAGLAAGQLWEKGPYAGLGTAFIAGLTLGGLVGVYVFYRLARRYWHARGWYDETP